MSYLACITEMLNYSCCLQLQLAEAEGMPLEDLAMYANGQPMEDSMVLANMVDMSTLDMEVRMLGGKISHILCILKYSHKKE